MVLVPLLSPIRVAIEVLLASGGRDTSFAGQIQLQLDNGAKDDEIPQEVHKTNCRLGLCLWDNLLLRGRPGKHKLTATVVERTASLEGLHRLAVPATSAPIMFKKVALAETSARLTTYDTPRQIGPDVRASLRYGSRASCVNCYGSSAGVWVLRHG